MKNILVAEDDSLVRECVLHFLKKLGYQASSANNGLEALKKIQSEPFDLFITDISMPKLNGRDLIVDLRRKMPNLPVIIMSGKEMEDDIEIRCSKNVRYYMKKPVNLALLGDKIVEVIGTEVDLTKKKNPDIERIAEIKEIKISSEIEKETRSSHEIKEEEYFLGLEKDPSQFIGKELCEIRILSFINKDEIGVIFKGFHLSLNKAVILKLIYSQISNDPGFTSSFEKEAALATRLEHDNIIKIYEAGHTGALYYLVMQDVNGENLAQLIQKGPLALDKAINIVFQTAVGLEVAHEERIIHQHIKPDNLIITKDNLVKIDGFGVAYPYITKGSIILQSEDATTIPYYMAPEQHQNKSSDLRTDIYSLGIVFFIALTGVIPYKRINDPLPPAHSVNPSIPQSISYIIHKMTAKNPDSRYQNCNSLIVALSQLNHEKI